MILRFEPDGSDRLGRLISTYLESALTVHCHREPAYRTRGECDVHLILHALARIPFKVDSSNDMRCCLIVIVPLASSVHYSRYMLHIQRQDGPWQSRSELGHRIQAGYQLSISIWSILESSHLTTSVFPRSSEGGRRNQIQ